MLLRMFQQQVLFQCQVFLLALHDLNSALVTKDMTRAWSAIQNMLNAAANISKALWGSGGKLALERKAIRESIGLLDNSPLRDVAMRNNFEHIDERLDTWWKDSPDHNLMDFNFGDMHTAVKGIDEVDIFRSFAPTTGELIFWSQRFSLQAIATEIASIFPKIQQEAQRPIWEPQKPKQPEVASGGAPDAANAQ
jgi:hypothetical protein